MSGEPMRWCDGAITLNYRMAELLFGVTGLLSLLHTAGLLATSRDA